MNADEDALLDQLVEILVREADPEAIILFGSRARGEAGPESDVDLLVVEREAFGAGRSRIREASRLYVALHHVPVATDLLVYSRDEVEHWKGSLNHVIGRAWREGRILHCRRAGGGPNRNPGMQTMTQPRRLFDELMEGVGAVHDRREAKVTLRTHKVEDFPPLVVRPDLIRDIL